MAEPLSSDQIEDALKGLRGWTFEADSLRKSFEFAHFKEAVGFIVRLAFEAEQQNHHPEIFNVYNKVDLSLSTHDAGNKVTERDVRLARKIEDFNWR